MISLLVYFYIKWSRLKQSIWLFGIGMVRTIQNPNTFGFRAPTVASKNKKIKLFQMNVREETDEEVAKSNDKSSAFSSAMTSQASSKAPTSDVTSPSMTSGNQQHFFRVTLTNLATLNSYYSTFSTMRFKACIVSTYSKDLKYDHFKSGIIWNLNFLKPTR